MENSSRAVRLNARDNRRLEFAAHAVIDSARLSDNSTGINWRRLPTTPIAEHYLTEYPGLTNQEIALRETLDEVERRVIEHDLDLDRIDNTGLQGTVEDVLNDILDFMVHDAQASSDDESETDSSGSGDSDDGSDSEYPPKSDSTSSNSDALHIHQAHRPHHEAEHANNSNPSRASSPRIQGPHSPLDRLHPISVPAQEHVSASNARNQIIEEPQQRNALQDDTRGTQDKGVNCCSTM